MRRKLTSLLRHPLLLGLLGAVALSVALAVWKPGMEAPEEEMYVLPPPGAPLDFSSLPNFHRVTDDLCRGAQPSYKGFGELKRMGIKTVVNLRWTRTDRRSAERFGLAYEHLPIRDLRGDVGHALSVLKIITDKKRCPVFVHCLNGADRTGFICAAYRVVVCGWDKEAAIREMKDSRFGADVDFGPMPDRIRAMDVPAIRKRLGLAP